MSALALLTRAFKWHWTTKQTNWNNFSYVKVSNNEYLFDAWPKLNTKQEQKSYS